MRRLISIAAAWIVFGWLAGCSKPALLTSQMTDPEFARSSRTIFMKA